MESLFPDVSVSTERLSLRAYDAEDVPALVEMMNDEAVVSWSPVPYPYTEAHALSWVTDVAPAERAVGAGIAFAVSEFLTQRLVGGVRLHHVDWDTRCVEVGYLTASWARGEGYASEAVLAVAQWLFHDQGFERLELRTAAGNTAAQQVAQKIGCISEGVLRNAGIARHHEADGGWSRIRTDLIVWSLLPEDLDGVAGRPADEYSYPDWH
jgi:RimJ/RimL family protein N-acetyltransferase